MPVIRTLTDRIAATLGDTVIRFRWWVILAALAAVAAAASGGRLLDFSNDYRVFFSDKNPELVAFDNFQATYTKNDNILFVLLPPFHKHFVSLYHFDIDGFLSNSVVSHHYATFTKGAIRASAA